MMLIHLAISGVLRRDQSNSVVFAPYGGRSRSYKLQEALDEVRIRRWLGAYYIQLSCVIAVMVVLRASLIALLSAAVLEWLAYRIAVAWCARGLVEAPSLGYESFATRADRVGRRMGTTLIMLVIIVIGFLLSVELVAALKVGGAESIFAGVVLAAIEAVLVAVLIRQLRR